MGSWCREAGDDSEPAVAVLFLCRQAYEFKQ